jgi:hypothetical protein
VWITRTAVAQDSLIFAFISTPALFGLYSVIGLSRELRAEKRRGEAGLPEPI